jgi:EmrB/QacA subfamily drug resistance transporter
VSVRAGRHEAPRPGLLALLAAAELMLTLDLSIVNVALPAIRDGLGFDQGSLQWVVNGYALTFAGFLLPGGRAADLLGRRRVFVTALGAFSLASLACGLAASGPALIAGRVVQGLSAGILAPTTLSILTGAFREPGARSRALAIWTGVAIGGGAVGGLLGGVLTSALSWRWIFFVNVPVGAWLIARAVALLPRSEPRRDSTHVDLAGAVTVTGGLTAVAWGLIRSTELGWGSGEVIGALVLAAALLGSFVVLELRVARVPLVPFSVLRSRPVWAGNLLSFLSFVPVMATWFFVTIYLQRVRGLTAIEAGVLFLPMSLAVIGGSQASFRLIRRLDARAVFLVGGLTAALGLASLARLQTGTGLAWVIAAASIAMAGGGLMFAPITVAATSTAPRQGGLASGLLNTTRQIGGALGLAVLDTIAARHAGAASPAALTAGFATAFEVGAVVFAATAVVGAIALPGRLSPRAWRPPRPPPTSYRYARSPAAR